MNYIKILLLAILGTALGLVDSYAAKVEKRSIRQVEKKADYRFIKQDFDRAMALFEEAVELEVITEYKAELQLKVARLYYLLRDYKKAAANYEKVLEADRSMIGARDICNYIDALRFDGLNSQAEAIALHYAYKDIYSKYQRFQNTLDALAMRHNMTGDPSFSVRRLSINTSYPEFWVNELDGQHFYATSFSKFNSPDKLFFHRTLYYEFDETTKPVTWTARKMPRPVDLFRNIPVELQSGPLVFSPNKDMMVATIIRYNRRGQIISVPGASSIYPFRSELVFSAVDKGRKSRRYSRYKPVFVQDGEYSYAHPCLVNDGKSLLFTSDMSGGYGGFDLYITHWDDAIEGWSQPVNLGPSVNTEGDEIFPVIFRDRLIFSSNGHPGFGGYDLFSVFFDNDHVVPGDIRHFPYPVNSEYNDTYMFPLEDDAGYIVSDRTLDASDDMFYYHYKDLIAPSEGAPFFGLSEQDAVMGGTALMSQLTENAIKTTERSLFPKDAPLQSQEPLLTIYFNFDSSTLTTESQKQLNDFLVNADFSKMQGLRIVGYADEMGGEQYNLVLSETRAGRVLDYLRSNGLSAMNMTKEGRGRIKLSSEELSYVLQSVSNGEDAYSKIDWIAANKRARRVEIYSGN